jgi:hypothetical protein
MTAASLVPALFWVPTATLFTFSFAVLRFPF